MRVFSLSILLLMLTVELRSQDYAPFTEMFSNLSAIRNQPEKVDQIWNSLVESGNIPFVVNDSVAFMYRGKASSVSWMGDFNGWGYDRAFNNKGTLIPGTDIWVLKTTFPRDARIDYKIVIDGTHWILDPKNEDHQWSGVGGGSPNSELRMPAWKPDLISLKPVEGLQRGQLESDLLLNSVTLGYQITYSVYLPVGYRKDTKYPVIYVTDGYEYMHPRMGNMILVLDNLIHLKKIEPVIAVFIDHREPVNRSNNRRMQELAMNEKYLEFIAGEFKSLIEQNYSVTAEASKTAILGTSMGGLTAAYFAFVKPDVFGLAGIQSPAFWFKPEIFTLCDNPSNPPVKTFLTTGLINDTAEGSKRMKTILDKNTCTYQYSEVNQGHSWGNWRDSVDDILIYFFSPASGG